LRAWIDVRPPDIVPDLHGLRSPVAEAHEWVRRIRADVRAVIANRTNALRSA